MAEPLLSARERLVWILCFVAVAAALVVTGFASSDPDSALYADISARLAHAPIAHWIAPLWYGLWPGTQPDELFREHPAGIFLVPMALDRLGVPALQAAYVVGIAAGLGSLVLLGVLIDRIASRDEARASLVLLQLMPVAFIFRIRANHEYPMLLCLFAALVGLDGVRRSWWWLPVVALSFTCAALVKGVFASLVLLGAGLWLLTNPTGAAGSALRQWVACVVGLATVAAVVVLYDAAYLRVTGEWFWWPYLVRQLGPVRIASPIEDARALGSHLFFYIVRLLWHPAPWSFALLWAGWRRWRSPSRQRPRLPARDTRGLAFVLAFAGLAVMTLSFPSKFAERYTFSATYVVGAAGVVAACRSWPALREAVRRLDARVPALPAMVWLLLMALRLIVGPFLPRVGA